MSFAVRADKLGKLYHLGATHAGSMRDLAIGVWKRLVGRSEVLLPHEEERLREFTDRAAEEDGAFWALRDVSFEVKTGDVVGIIGPNGSGKSTILKILSQITAPTTGRVELHGRVASLLEVGTGFHPELSGRENVFLNGAILGMSKTEIRRKFDEIVAFSEIEKFIDTPVKRYSSGMYVRLAFAVAAHLEPEILIVDEVLAVGDAAFQKKCLGKMGVVAQGGRTVLFVSHSMQAIRTLCNSAIILDRGRIQYAGSVSNCASLYLEKNPNNKNMVWSKGRNGEKSPFYFEEIRIALHGSHPRMVLNCDLRLRGTAQAPSAFVAIDIFDSFLTPIMQALPVPEPFLAGVAGKHELQIDVCLPPLIPGRYIVDFWLGSDYTETLDYVQQEVVFEIAESPSKNRSFPHSREHGQIVPVSSYEYRSPA